MGCSTEDFSPGDDEQEENNPWWLPEMVEVEKIDAKDPAVLGLFGVDLCL